MIRALAVEEFRIAADDDHTSAPDPFGSQLPVADHSLDGAPADAYPGREVVDASGNAIVAHADAFPSASCAMP